MAHLYEKEILEVENPYLNINYNDIQKANEYIEFKKKHNFEPVNYGEEKELYKWCKNMKKEYKKGNFDFFFPMVREILLSANTNFFGDGDLKKG